MSKFGLYGKITAQPGQRDALVAGLLEAAALMQHVPGCELYIVNVSATDTDTVWVTEVWSSASAHEASLTQDEIKALIKRSMPLIAGGERIEIVPLGGKGLPTD
jgi:quinol monooxygenase YgiN